VHKFSQAICAFQAAKSPAKAGLFVSIEYSTDLTAAMTVMVAPPTMAVSMSWDSRSCHSGEYDQRKQNLLHL